MFIYRLQGFTKVDSGNIIMAENEKLNRLHQELKEQSQKLGEMKQGQDSTNWSRIVHEVYLKFSVK